MAQSTGLNDNLNGVERPVNFDMQAFPGENIEVVQSLAKWKRMALKEYGFQPGEGLYTNMNAIRRDEELDNLHSCYVDQWDWEKVITREQRNTETLKETVRTIFKIIKHMQHEVWYKYPDAVKHLPKDITFVTSEELEERYPDKTPKERENLITREHGCVFLMKIGEKLKNGKPHDGRAPDYDDWQLNGDILFWYDLLDCALEISRASGLTKSLWTNSSPKPAAMTAGICPITKCFSPVSSPARSAEVSASPVSACCF